MKNTSLSAGFTACAIGLAAVLGCSRFLPASNTGTTNASNTVVSNSAPRNAAPSNATSTSSNPKLEKADFTMTSEELDREYTHDGVTSNDLKKFENKVIQVSGRVSMLIKEKKGTVQPWVTLSAPGIGHGVNCYFDDEDVSQMSKLQEDKPATIQGFQNDFVVPKVSPMLKHCQVAQ